MQKSPLPELALGLAVLLELLDVVAHVEIESKM
jgi:hypothetical protein